MRRYYEDELRLTSNFHETRILILL